MNIVFKYILICWFLSTAVESTAQSAGLYNPVLQQSSNSLFGKIIGEVFYMPPGANSNYFLHSEWVKGTIIFRSGEVFNNYRLRYNAFEDELIAYNGNTNVMMKVDKEKVQEFVLNLSETGAKNADMLIVNIDSASNIQNTNYFECLYRGTIMLLISNRIVELKVSPYHDSSGRLRDTEFVLRKANFIYSSKTGTSRVRFSNYSVASLYPENKREIKKTLRQNRMRITDARSAALALELLDKKGLVN